MGRCGSIKVTLETETSTKMSDHQPYQQQLQEIEEKIKNNETLLEDPDLQELAQEELAMLKKQLAALQEASASYQESLQEQEAAENNPTLLSNALIELRAGAGGDEAKIWAEDLLRMYLRFAESQNLKAEFIDDTTIKISGRTSLELEIKTQEGDGLEKTLEKAGSDSSEETSTVKKQFYPYQLFRHEAGVHRVQRVPTTETQGRIHTSTASVAVLPELKKHSVEIRDEDLVWEFMRSGGAGGQSVNKTSSAVRLTHKPSGVVVRVSRERKQAQNREIALDLLRAQLWELQEEERLAKIDSARSAIGRNMRAEKIRTYNYPQNRVTDHRLNQSWHQLDTILEGDLEPVIRAVKSEVMREGG